MAIAANELRIGNWYNCANPMEGGKLYPNQFTVWTEYLDFEAYGEPVLISRHILTTCGFTDWEAFEGGYISIGIGKYLMMRLFKDDWICWICDINIKKHLYENPQKIIKNVPKYLHQLQNLYFALTGNELNYTPTTIK